MDYKIKQQLVERIFKALDNKDKVHDDHKIEKCTWNAFAQLAGGNGINYAILEENAKKSISTYLSRGDKVVNKMLEYCNIDSVELTGKTPEKSEHETPTNKPTAVDKTKDSAKTTAKDAKVNDCNNPQKPKQTTNTETNTKAKSEVKTDTETPDYSKEFYKKVCGILDKVPKEYRWTNHTINNDYWAPKIAKLSQTYNVKPEIIATIIAMEVHYHPQEGKPLTDNSVGPMQIEEITVKDMSGRTNLYMAIDKQLTEEILYPNGQDKKLSIREIRQKCIDDCEYGMKVGILCYKIKELKALKSFFPNLSIETLAKDIGKYKSKLTIEQKESLLRRTFKNYNGSEKYANSAMSIYKSIGGTF